jgi:hypothetical protein
MKTIDRDTRLGPGGTCGISKSEIRNPKSEINPSRTLHGQRDSYFRGSFGFARLLLLWAMLVASGVAQGAIFTDTPSQPIPIPDGGTDLGISRTITVSGMAPTLSDISVVLNVSGGFNGDIYATLRGPGGVSAPLAVLLNRVGVTGSNPSGYSDAGFNITLADSGSDIHSHGGNGSSQLTGTYAPDGRTIDPGSPGAAFDSADRTKLLSQFNDTNPNGVWTVTFSDWVNSGDESSLAGWSLNITAVPERTNVALAIFWNNPGWHRSSPASRVVFALASPPPHLHLPGFLAWPACSGPAELVVCASEIPKWGIHPIFLHRLFLFVPVA